MGGKGLPGKAMAQPGHPQVFHHGGRGDGQGHRVGFETRGRIGDENVLENAEDVVKSILKALEINGEGKEKKR